MFGYSTFLLFQNDLNTGYRLDIMFMIARCGSSIAVVTPVIFRHDLDNDLVMTLLPLKRPPFVS